MAIPKLTSFKVDSEGDSLTIKTTGTDLLEQIGTSRMADSRIIPVLGELVAEGTGKVEDQQKMQDFMNKLGSGLFATNRILEITLPKETITEEIATALQKLGGDNEQQTLSRLNNELARAGGFSRKL